MKSIVTDSEFQSALDEKGVSAIKFSSTQLIDQLREVFESLHQVPNETMKTGYYFSIYKNDKNYRQALYDKIYPLIGDCLQSVFHDFKVLAIIAQVKGVGPNSTVNIHQDLTMVDESKYRSYTLWIPLEDSTEKNGALSFLESSHLGLRNFRTHTIGYLYDEAEVFIRENAKTYLTSKGNALIFDTATLHFSEPNRSEKPRYSLGISIVSKDAETEILYYDKFKPFDGSASRFAVPNDFWYRYNDFEKERLLPPAFGEFVGQQDGIRVLPYTKDEFIQHYQTGLESVIKSQFNASVVPVLNNTELQNKLNEDGFILVDFLTPTEVKGLQGLFDRMNGSRTDIPYDRLYTCQHNPDAAYRAEMSREIGNIVNPALSRHFINVKNTVYTFQIKGIGPQSELMIHQDWTFARKEDGYRTYTLWIPLVDSDESNGTISILRGSHLLVDDITGALIEPSYKGLEAKISDTLEPLKINTGQLLLFDGALIHYSSANLSQKIRISVMSNILASSANIYLYFPAADGTNSVEEYSVPDEFVLLYSDYRSEYDTPPPFGTKIRQIEKRQLHNLKDWL